MSEKQKKEITDEASTVAGVKGYTGPLGGSSYQKGKKKKKKKNNPSKPFGEEKLFEELVVDALLNNKDINEVVKKRGQQWIVFDDETGAQLQSFKTREDAWKHQRNIRKQKKQTRELEKKHKETEKKSSETEKAKKTGAHSSVHKAARPQQIAYQKPKQRESKENVKKIVKENFLTYVFEQNPVSERSYMWDKFIEGLTKQTLLADPKLKNLLEKVEKTKVKVVEKAYKELDSLLEKKGHGFQVASKKIKKDEKYGVIADFLIKLQESNLSIPVSIKIENGKPVVDLPKESVSSLNSVSNDETKLLRAELIHIQENSFDNIDDLIKEKTKRDKYLNKLEENIDNSLGSYNALELAIAKHLMKNKYRGIK